MSSDKKSLGIASDNGSKVCQVCGLYFSPEHDEKVCPKCEGKKKTFYPITETTTKSYYDVSIEGYIIGIIFAICVLYGLGNIL